MKQLDDWVSSKWVESETRGKGTQLILNNPINYTRVVSETFQKILCNKGFNIDTEHEEAKKVLTKFVLDNDFKIKMAQIVQLCSEWGYCVPILEKTKGGHIMLSFAEPSFISKFGKVYMNEIAAVLYEKSNIIDDTSYFVRKEFNDKYVVINTYIGNKKQSFNLEQVSAEVPKEWQSMIDMSKSTKQPHYMNCVPLGIIYNKSYFLYGRFNAITQTMVQEQTDTWNAKGAFELSNRVLVQMYKELVINRSRFMGNLSATEIQQMKESKDMSEILSDVWIQKTPEQGATKTVNAQFLQADPKLDVYIQAYMETFKVAMRAVGISEGSVDTGTQKTTGEIAMVLNNTTETLKLRRIMLAEQIMKQILDKVLLANDINPYDDDGRIYNFDIVGTDMVDETNLTATLIQQIDNGLATREYAVGRLRNINSADAEQAILEIDEKRDRDMQYMMEDDEDAGKPQTSNQPVKE